jgi:hypothetical protein
VAIWQTANAASRAKSTIDSPASMNAAGTWFASLGSTMTANAGSEGPSTETVDPATPKTVSRSAGSTKIVFGLASVVFGFTGLFFFFFVPALAFVLLGIVLLVSGSRDFGRGEPRLAKGPGRAG